MDTKDRTRRSRPAGKPQGRPPAKKSRGSTAVKKPRRRVRSEAKKQAEAQIVYTQPKAFNRNRFLLRLATVVAVVLALLFGMSIFFKVKYVTVSGAQKYTAWEIREASGIQEGENLLTLSEAKVSGRIRTALPYVYSARVGIKLPDTVNIEIVELNVVYAAQAQDDSWWLLDASGKVVEKTTGAAALGYTRIQGVLLESPQIGAQAVALEPEPTETLEDGQTVPVAVQAAEQLDVVISILQYLEENGVIGQIATVNVADLSRIELWYADRYQVILGDTGRLDYKIRCMKQAVDQQTKYQTGVLDVSFTTWPDQVGFTPFEL